MTIEYCNHGYPSNASCPSCELADRDAEIERLKAIANGRICSACMEQHPINSMCPPHEMRVTGSEWFRQQVSRLEHENAELRANLEHCASAANDPESCAALAIQNAELRKDAERWRRIVSLSEREGAAWSLEAAVESEEVQGNGL